MDVFGFQTLQHVMRMTRTWDSTMSMIPKGGDTIWGGLDWSPEEGHDCSLKKKNDNGQTTAHNRTDDLANSFHAKYGRIISFGKDVSNLHSSEIERVDFRVMFQLPFIDRFENIFVLIYVAVSPPHLSMLKHV